MCTHTKDKLIKVAGIKLWIVRLVMVDTAFDLSIYTKNDDEKEEEEEEF